MGPLIALLLVAGGTFLLFRSGKTQEETGPDGPTSSPRRPGARTAADRQGRNRSGPNGPSARRPARPQQELSPMEARALEGLFPVKRHDS